MFVAGKVWIHPSLSIAVYAYSQERAPPPEIIGPGMSSVVGRTNELVAELDCPEETTATEYQNDAESTTDMSQDQATTPTEFSEKGILEA
jgi:hypothetical protein